MCAPINTSLDHLTQAYVAWAGCGRYAPATVRARRGYLRHLRDWLAARRVTHIHGLTAERLEAYRADLYQRRTISGRPIGAGAITQRLLALRGFLRWCLSRHVDIPAWEDALALPRREHRLPRRVLTAPQVERLLALPDLATTLGLRDRAILETLYATGIRRAELTGLTRTDVDPARCTVFVRQGKGGRDRVVPLGRRALQWINRYVRLARPVLVRGTDPEWLFLTRRGRRWHPKHLGERVTRYLHRAGLAPAGTGGCHVFRHTMATLMFERGADIRALQAILGHARLSTTELYTHVGIPHLCAVHARTHPGTMRHIVGCAGAV